MSNKIPLIAISAILIGGIAVTFMKTDGPTGKTMSMNGHSTPQGKVFTVQDVKLPALNLTEKRGEAAFNKNCAACHGERAIGTEQGPPFLNRVYVPGHHGNQAFFQAIKTGTTQHHWPYGDMPPQPQVSQGDAASIIAYVRAVQAANGFAR
ncbi:MAG: cytochrome c [Magnetovibrio sp.]|nr:cytochrome c [Magnetovibrio sp.]